MDYFSFIVFSSVVLLNIAGLTWFLKLTVITWSHKTLSVASRSLSLSLCVKASCWLSCRPAASQWLSTICPPTRAMPTLETQQVDQPPASWLPWGFCDGAWWLDRICFCLVLSLVFKGRSPNAAELYGLSSSKTPAHCKSRGMVLGTIVRSHTPDCGKSVLCAELCLPCSPLPQFTRWSSNPQCDCIWRYGL